MDWSALFGNLRGILLKAFYVLATAGGLQFVGGFSPREGYTVALALFVVYWYAIEKIPQTMSPFAVSVDPKWFALLKDTGLIEIETGEGIKRAEDIGVISAVVKDAAGNVLPKQERQVNKRTGYDVLTHGISFTVLPPVAKSYASKGWAPRLIYSNNHHVFLSRSNLFDGIREPIEGLSAPWTWIQGKDPNKPIKVYGDSPIRFYVRLREVRLHEVGLEIGVQIPDFDDFTRQHPSVLDSFKNSTGDFLPVATLPPEVFEYYYRPQDYDYSRSGGVGRFHKYQERLKARLSEFGWNQDDPTYGTHYEHKYADVYIREII